MLKQIATLGAVSLAVALAAPSLRAQSFDDKTGTGTRVISLLDLYSSDKAEGLGAARVAPPEPLATTVETAVAPPTEDVARNASSADLLDPVETAVASVTPTAPEVDEADLEAIPAAAYALARPALPETEPVAVSMRPVPRPASFAVPELRWSHVRGSASWTRSAIQALATHGSVLPQTVPGDIEAWCPAYADAPASQRRLFWAGLISALAEHESTWRPGVAGDGGKSIGLLQIRPGTARGYGCDARSGTALRNGAANVACAVRIMAQTVARDGVVSRGMRGVAADWGPFHQRSKREDMRAWVRQQPYCAAPVRLDRPRPMPRPQVAREASLRTPLLPAVRPVSGAGQ